jgi:hypothetical protein
VIALAVILVIFYLVQKKRCTEKDFAKSSTWIAAYMKTTKQIPKKTILRFKQKTLTDKCQRPGINLLL